MRTAGGFWAPLAHAADIVSDAAAQARRKPDNQLVQLLLMHGADPNLPLSDGKTPADVMAGYMNEEGEAILRAAGGRRTGDNWL